MSSRSDRFIEKVVRFGLNVYLIGGYVQKKERRTKRQIKRQTDLDLDKEDK